MIKYKDQEINASFISSASDEQLTEVRESFLEAILHEPSINISWGWLLAMLIAMYFAFMAVLTVLCMVFTGMICLHYVCMRAMKSVVRDIDEELYRRKLIGGYLKK